MKTGCHCGRIGIVADSDQVTVTCTKCEWHYTYKSVPKRLLKSLDELNNWLKKYKEKFGEDEN